MMPALLFALVVGQYTETEAKAIFDEANEAALAGDTTKAKAGYQKLLEANQGGADVLFNLGSACLMGNELGPAVLALEQAKRLSADDDIEAQLALANSRQLDKVVGGASEAPLVQRLAEAVDERLVSALCLICGWLALGAWWWARRKRSTPVIAAAAVLGLATVVAASLSAAHAWVATNIEEAVVMREAVPVRDAAREGARVSFEVHAGLKVRVMDRAGSFSRIRLANALEGWVENEAVERL
jgi:tetratricopeptide (TPR) repeat protein